MQSFANKTAIASIWIKSHLDAQAIQKVATRAFKALERMAFGKAKKVRFKQKGQFSSLEGKTNKQGITWTGNDVEWSKLKLSGIITNDPVILHGLNSKIKYVRLEDVLKVEAGQKLCESPNHNTYHRNINKSLRVFW